MHIIVVLSTIRLEKVWKMSHIKRHIKRFGSKVTIAITSGVEKKVRKDTFWSSRRVIRFLSIADVN